MKFYIIIFSIALVSCNGNEKANNTTDTKVPPVYTKADLSQGCYRMIVGKDSAIINLNLNGDSVAGTLQYNRFEKDDNAGSFTGKLDSNKVIGWYKFQSEGVITVRQVIFKIVGDKLAEGYGDVNAVGDTAYFTYPHTLNYEETHPFEKITCP